MVRHYWSGYCASPNTIRLSLYVSDRILLAPEVARFSDLSPGSTLTPDSTIKHMPQSLGHLGGSTMPTVRASRLCRG